MHVNAMNTRNNRSQLSVQGANFQVIKFQIRVRMQARQLTRAALQEAESAGEMETIARLMSRTLICEATCQGFERIEVQAGLAFNSELTLDAHRRVRHEFAFAWLLTRGRILS